MFYNFDITVLPTVSEPEIVVQKEDRRIKWRFPRRINMLAKAKKPVQKYVYPDPHEQFQPKYVDITDPEVTFRADHLARLPIRKFLDYPWHLLDKKTVDNLRKALKKSWNAIYFYYRKQIRDRRIQMLKRREKRRKEKKLKSKKTPAQIAKEHDEHNKLLAKPKKLFLPEKLIRKWKAIEDLIATIDALAEPKRRAMPPERQLGVVAKAALTYEITEEVMKLYQLPERMRIQPEEEHLLPGNVNPRARYAICTPRLEELSKPSLSRREARKNDDDKFDPFEISRTALKYKPTARILELAKPLERD